MPFTNPTTTTLSPTEAYLVVHSPSMTGTIPPALNAKSTTFRDTSISESATADADVVSTHTEKICVMPIDKISVYSDSDPGFNCGECSDTDDPLPNDEPVSDFDDDEYPKYAITVKSPREFISVHADGDHGEDQELDPDTTITVENSQPLEINTKITVLSPSNHYNDTDFVSPITDGSGDEYDNEELNNDSDARLFKQDDYYLSSSNIELGIANTITLKPIDSISVIPSPTNTRFTNYDNEPTTTPLHLIPNTTTSANDHSGLLLSPIIEPLSNNTPNNTEITSNVISDPESELALETAPTSLKSKSPSLATRPPTHYVLINNKTTTTNTNHYGLKPLSYMYQEYNYNTLTYNDLSYPIAFPNDPSSSAEINFDFDTIRNLRIQLANPEKPAHEYLDLLTTTGIISTKLVTLASSGTTNVELTKESVKLIIDLFQYIPNNKYPFYAYHTQFSNSANALFQFVSISQNYHHNSDLYAFGMGALFYLFNMLRLSSINLIFESIFNDDQQCFKHYDTSSALFSSLCCIKLEILKICIVAIFKNSMETDSNKPWKFNEFYEFNEKLTRYLNQVDGYWNNNSTVTTTNANTKTKLQELVNVWNGIISTSQILSLDCGEDDVVWDSGCYRRVRNTNVD